MTIFLTSLFLAVILCVVLWIVVARLDYYTYDWCMWIGIPLAILNLIFTVIVFIGLICVPFYLSAKSSIKIINQKYDTNYTPEDYFFAGNIIDKIIKTDKNLVDDNKKINLNITNKE